jgi:hypothetical protein
MDTIQLNSQKQKLAKQILNERNVNVINELTSYFNRMKKTNVNFPCQMTTKELKAEVEQSIIQYERGESKTHEAFFNEIKSW